MRITWERDSQAYDPSARIARLEDGYALRSVLPPGFPMTVTFNGFCIGMAEWENVAQATAVIEAHREAHRVTTNARPIYQCSPYRSETIL
jgi:hypothetical protein